MIEMIPAWVEGVLQPVEKLKAHQLGLRHKAVSVFVLRGPQMLLQQRALGKYHTPGLWANACCTHPKWDEDSLTCAERRLREELGIIGVSPRFSTTLEYRADVGQGLTEHELVDVFCAEAAEAMTVDPSPEEIADYRWIQIDDLRAEIAREPERFTPWLKIYVSDYAEQIFASYVGPWQRKPA